MCNYLRWVLHLGSTRGILDATILHLGEVLERLGLQLQYQKIPKH